MPALAPRLPPQIQLMFRWADVDDLGSVTDEQVIDLFDNVRQAVPGLVHKKQMISAMLSVPRDRDKRIGAPSFHSLCNSWPYLYFPLVRLQVHMYSVIVIARCSCPHHYPLGCSLLFRSACNSR